MTPPAGGLPWPELQRLAEGVWLWPGARGEMDAANGGRVGNASVIVGRSGVLVVDSGSARLHGLALLAAVRRITTLPVRALLLTHARQEFVFGAQAFREAGIPVLMGERSARLMASRCESCLRTLQRELGTGWMAGSALLTPDVPIADDSPRPELPAVLRTLGRPLRLLSHGHSSGPGDLAVLDEPSGLLVAGGLVDVGRVPDVQDADLAGWQRALAALGELPLKAIVPGHGPASAPGPALQALRAYLQAVDARARVLARAGAALSEVPDASAPPADAPWAAWDQADTIHRRNAAILFLRHERQLLQE